MAAPLPVKLEIAGFFPVKQPLGAGAAGLPVNI
jgi:hypothetical protein